MCVECLIYRDYDALKEKKVALQKEKDKVAQDVNFLKKQVRIGLVTDTYNHVSCGYVTLGRVYTVSSCISSLNAFALFCLNMQLRTKELELKTCRDTLSANESDLQHSEHENQNLRKKVEMLEIAIESPGSKAALKRILER